MRKGKVWLVGAGPGAAGLLTQRGAQVLSEAEVVCYDKLVGDEVLALIPDAAEAINVGKRSGRHTMPQEEISRLLAEKAGNGKRVVRLKGGDPFLFGRGGEELEVLIRENIPFEVVPGVTSALAVPAYNGIPVTHRDHASSVQIITGHRRANREYDIDFQALARSGSTMIFLMGIASMPVICEGLIRAGMDPNTPAAVLQQGTTARQKKIVATLETIVEETERQSVETPAIIVVGQVCAYAETFAWYGKRPLAGRKVLVTRPRERDSLMARKLREAGAEVLELPAIRICPLEENEQLAHAIQRIRDYHWLVFTSPRGVDIFFDAMMANDADARDLSHIKVAVIGPGTGKRLKARGILPDLMPEEYSGRALGELLALQCEKDARILIPRARIGSRELTEILARREDLKIDDIPTYDTEYVVSRAIDIAEECRDDKIDCAAFTSASTVEAFVRTSEGIEYGRLKAVCIGEQTAAAAASHGMDVYVSREATIDSLTERIIELLGKR